MGESASVSYLLNHMRTQVNTELSDPWPGGLNKLMIWIIGLLMEKIVTYLRNYCLNPCIYIVAVVSASSTAR